MRVYLLVSLLLLTLPVALGATIHGTVYHEDLSVARNVLVAIDTQPQQRMLSLQGAYSFDIPPGDYRLTVMYVHDGRNATLEEPVSVVQEGSFTYDLFLFPSLEEDEELLTDIDADLSDPAEAVPDEGDGPWPIITLVAVILLLLIVPPVWLYRHFKRLNEEYGGAQAEKGAEAAPDEGLERILAILKEEDGRLSQKELRQKLPYSEAKVSLMLTELEHRGRIERIRKGRANVVVLKR